MVDGAQDEAEDDAGEHDQTQAVEDAVDLLFQEQDQDADGDGGQDDVADQTASLH
jgi:hypothetical protein